MRSLGLTRSGLGRQQNPFSFTAARNTLCQSTTAHAFLTLQRRGFGTLGTPEYVSFAWFSTRLVEVSNDTFDAAGCGM
jgi:hypothetical protein